MNEQTLFINSSQKVLPTFTVNSKVELTPLIISSNFKIQKCKPKKIVWRASQKVLKQWQEDLDRINKEEISIKRSLKEINTKYNLSIVKKQNKSLDQEFIEDKKQKELERSLAYIDDLLKGVRKRQKFHT